MLETVACNLTQGNLIYMEELIQLTLSFPAIVILGVKDKGESETLNVKRATDTLLRSSCLFFIYVTFWIFLALHVILVALSPSRVFCVL